jgi:hypothetical protein
MALNKNALLLKSLSLTAETLSCNAAKNQFPVLLRQLAERRRVTAVEFRPLLVDAMLTTHPNGFRIFFNSNGEDASELQKRFQGECQEQLMSSRLRFSLAHELAHTFFYNLSEGTPKLEKQFRPGGKRTERENLERSCNKLAAQMLLPTPMLKAALRRMETIDPRSLSEFAKQAGVSIEALVRRLSGQSALLEDPYFRGCVVLVKETHGEVFVTAIAKPPHLNIARGLHLMRSGERWQLAKSDGSPVKPQQLPPQSRVNLTVETHQSATQKHYQISQMEINQSNTAISRLITFEEIENG